MGCSPVRGQRWCGPWRSTWACWPPMTRHVCQGLDMQVLPLAWKWQNLGFAEVPAHPPTCKHWPGTRYSTCCTAHVPRESTAERLHSCATAIGVASCGCAALVQAKELLVEAGASPQVAVLGGATIAGFFAAACRCFPTTTMRFGDMFRVSLGLAVHAFHIPCCCVRVQVR